MLQLCDWISSRYTPIPGTLDSGGHALHTLHISCILVTISVFIIHVVVACDLDHRWPHNQLKLPTDTFSTSDVCAHYALTTKGNSENGLKATFLNCLRGHTQEVMGRSLLILKTLLQKGNSGNVDLLQRKLQIWLRNSHIANTKILAPLVK